MEYIALIISGLALLAAGISLFLIIREIKRNEKRNAAALRYCDVSCGELSGLLETCRKKIEDLENGIVPDYEEQRKAADAVNDFARGISGILGFDPMEAARKEREQKSARGG